MRCFHRCQPVFPQRIARVAAGDAQLQIRAFVLLKSCPNHTHETNGHRELFTMYQHRPHMANLAARSCVSLPPSTLPRVVYRHRVRIVFSEKSCRSPDQASGLVCSMVCKKNQMKIICFKRIAQLGIQLVTSSFHAIELAISSFHVME